MCGRVFLGLVKNSPIQTPILNGFEQVGLLDALRAGEIGDGARHFKDPIIRPGGKRKLFHGVLEQVTEGGIDSTMTPDLRMRHPRVGGDPRSGKALQLPCAGGLNAVPQGSRGLARRRRAQIRHRQRRRLNMEIDPVEQGAADARPVALDLRRRAAALMAGIAQIAAGAGS